MGYMQIDHICVYYMYAKICKKMPFICKQVRCNMLDCLDRGNDREKYKLKYKKMLFNIVVIYNPDL